MKDTSRTIKAAIAALTGLFLVFFNPGLVDATVNKLLLGLTENGSVAMGSVPALRMYVSSYWRGLEVIVGAALIAMAIAFYMGKKWAFPISMVALAIVPVGSFYTGLLFMVKTKSLPPAWIAFIIGLLAFWAMLFLEKKEKPWAFFVPLTILGMIGTQAFAFAEHGLRGIFPDLTASVTDPTIGVLRFSGPIMAFLVPILLFSIWALSAGKESGWWASLVVGFSMAVASFPVHFARPKASMALPGTAEASIFTSTYFLGGALGVILVVVMLIPYFKNQFVSQE
ncbi:MAG: hypothetical protein ACOYY3_18090 [Chloroflexota bacterium]